MLRKGKSCELSLGGLAKMLYLQHRAPNECCLTPQCSHLRVLVISKFAHLTMTSVLGRCTLITA